MSRGSTKLSTTDGRILRSERSRELIADGLYELVGEGDLEPTAEQVAERAGVGIRTVFRLFSDMDSLYATMNARLLSEVAPMLREGPPEDARLRDRATGLVADRAALFERVANYMRATNRSRGRSTFLTDEYRKIVRQLRERLLRWLPELREAQTDLVEALDQATSFEAWDRLRSDQRLGRTRAQAAMERTVLALVRELEKTR